MSEISLKEMAKNAVHYGHPTTRWNPKMKRFIFGERYGIHIFDLNKTAKKLAEALDFLENAARANKTILFVGTKQQAGPLLKEIHESTGYPIVTDKWTPGFLTNFKTIKKRIDHFKKLKADDASGALSKYTKKEQTKLRKEIQDLSAVYTGVEDMEAMPDALFVVDVVRDHIPVSEARRMKIPVVGIVDTNADPDTVDYLIPANDDATRSLRYILDLVKEAVSKKK